MGTEYIRSWELMIPHMLPSLLSVPVPLRARPAAAVFHAGGGRPPASSWRCEVLPAVRYVSLSFTGVSLHGPVLADDSIPSSPIVPHQGLFCHTNFIAAFHCLSFIQKECYLQAPISLELLCFLDTSGNGSRVCFLWFLIFDFVSEGRDNIFDLSTSYSLFHTSFANGVRNMSQVLC